MLAPFMIAYKMPHTIFPWAASHIGTMPRCKSTLGYIDLGLSNAEEERCSPPGVGEALSILRDLIRRRARSSG
jgi:hypothetical protein